MIYFEDIPERIPFEKALKDMILNPDTVVIYGGEDVPVQTVKLHEGDNVIAPNLTIRVFRYEKG